MSLERCHRGSCNTGMWFGWGISTLHKENAECWDLGDFVWKGLSDRLIVPGWGEHRDVLKGSTKWLVVGCFVWQHDIKFLSGFLHLVSCMTLLLFFSMSPGFWRLVVAGLQRSFWRELPQKTPSFRWKNLQVRQRFPELQRPSENALDDETLSPLISISSTAIAHQLYLSGSLCSREALSYLEMALTGMWNPGSSKALCTWCLSLE